MFGQLLERDANQGAISIYDWAKMFQPGIGVVYNGQSLASFKLSSGSAGAGFYDTNSVVFACTANRILLFSEARFQFQRIRNGRPGDLFGTADLAILEEPWRGATTGELLAQAELDVTCYGNSYWVHDSQNPGFLLRLDPSKVTILTEGAYDATFQGTQVGERLLAYAYRESQTSPVTIFEPSDVAHYKPYPDRTNRWIGTSWLNACLPDIEADVQLTEHKKVATANGAQIPYVVTMPELPSEAFEEAVKAFRRLHEGPENAGKTVFLSGGADLKTVGQTFEQLSMKPTQGAGESRIAACAGVPPIIVGLSEGLEAATYSNYSQARRRLVDGTMRPLWRSFSAAMHSVVNVPPDARLWYDDRDIPFLRDDILDLAEVKSRDAATIASLVQAGFAQDSVVDAVTSGDFTRLSHTGLFSVQLQPANQQPALPASVAPGPQRRPSVPIGTGN